MSNFPLSSSSSVGVFRVLTEGGLEALLVTIRKVDVAGGESGGGRVFKPDLFLLIGTLPLAQAVPPLVDIPGPGLLLVLVLLRVEYEWVRPGVALPFGDGVETCFFRGDF
mmetsp:Transcript_27796/g.58256  ORF Transcript_27796/g.58256 Transcript_27796/m.58256 type:complete len:110 (-) Transcript_27796:85-414(-)